MVLASGFVQTVFFLMEKRRTLNETREVVMLSAGWRAALIFPAYVPEWVLAGAGNTGLLLLHSTLYICIYLEHFSEKGNVLKFLEL